MLVNVSDFDPEAHELHEENPDEIVEELTEQGDDQGSGEDEGSDTAEGEEAAEGASAAESEGGEIAFEDLPRSDKLAEAGYETVEDVLEADPQDLLEVDGFGEGSLETLTDLI